jgi:hypothetical protein
MGAALEQAEVEVTALKADLAKTRAGASAKWLQLQEQYNKKQARQIKGLEAERDALKKAKIPKATPGLVGSPHVHSPCLVPVSFAGLLIKCLHFIGMTWAFAQVRSHVALCGRLRAVLGYPRPWGCQPR